MSLPDYINCKSETIMHCDFYMHQECPETCAYARDIKGLGVGAMMIPIQRLSDKGIDDEVDSQKSHKTKYI